MHFHNLDECYHHLLTQQASIGWEQLFYGWFVKTWCTLQDEHAQNSDTKHMKTTGERWVIGLIKIIWTHVHENCESCTEKGMEEMPPPEKQQNTRLHNEKPWHYMNTTTK